MTGSMAPNSVPIPTTHLDLLTRPISGVLTAIGHDGHPQSSLVWVDIDRGCARFNTALQRQKDIHLHANPKVSLLIVDPDNISRFIQIRGDAELVTEVPPDHFDPLTRKDTDPSGHTGDVHPASKQSPKVQATGRIHARRVTLDGIHASG